jgi:putative copper resistance protein D
VRILLALHGVALGIATLLLAAAAMGRPDGAAIAPRSRRALVAASAILIGPVTLSGIVILWTTPDGLPALLGTRRGRLVLVQTVLLAIVLGTLARVRRLLAHGSLRRLRLVVAIEAALCLGMTMIATWLAVRPAGIDDPLIWPFRVRLAPGVMWRIAPARDQVAVGFEIMVAGALALMIAHRVRSWRPMLVAAGIGLALLGLVKSLSAMSLDAYPTTYARPAVAPTPVSIERGRTLFSAHCAVCHGAAGRGDGPASGGLLQRPADLSAPHTADHTPGDLFWWVTHGLGLAMPAFGDQLSVDERWDLINFVRTLSAPARLPASETSDGGG